MRRRTVAALALALALAASACWAGDETPVSDLGDATPTGASPQEVVQLLEFRFAIPLPVAAGEELVVIDSGDLPHTFTIREAGIDTGVVAPGEQATVTAPAEPGTYEVVCTLHPEQMRATLRVESG